MPAPPSNANTVRFDPYKNYRFKVKMDGTYVARVNKVSTLKRSTGVIKHRTGGEPSTVRVSPGQSTYDAIALEQGVTHDVSFEQWANKVWDYRKSTGTDPAVSLKDFRRDLIIELYDDAGQKVGAWTVYHCWASEFQALPALDGMANAIVIQTLTLETEGWEGDTGAIGLTEPA